MKKKIDVGHLKFGMYVSELDRPWTDTNFAFQGFLLSNINQLEELKRQCSYVIVETERSDPELFPMVVHSEKALRDSPNGNTDGFFAGLKSILRNALEKRSSVGSNDSSSTQLQARMPQLELQISISEEEKRRYIDNMKELRRSFHVPGAAGDVIHQYENTTDLEEEVANSTQIHDDFCKLASELVENLSSKALSERLDLAEDLIASIVESMVRNSDAMELLSRLKGMDEYSYNHAVNVSVRLIAFGRQLGFPKKQLQQLGMGGLLLDIGRTKLPSPLLRTSTRYTPEEYEIEKRHVLEGVDLLTDAGDVSREVIEIVQRHHERHDGSGYPQGLKGQAIGLFGSMAGIVDTYCAMIMKRSYATPITSANALRAIVDSSDSSFHSGLVDQFVQTIGIYPVGALVELNSSEIGIVVRQNRWRRLRPTVLVILDSQRQPYPDPPTVDLIYTPITVAGEELAIRQELNPGAYGIDPADYFL